jgi:cytochrome c oxidase subunit 2
MIERLKFCLSLLLLFYTSNVFADQYALVANNAQPLSNKVCVTCHGGAGVGNPVVGAPSLAGLESWYLRNQLIGFRANFRGAQAQYIPAYEMQDSVAKLSDSEIDQLVAYISAWEPVSSAPTFSGDTNHGSEIYASCAACHGIFAEGNELLNAPALASRDDWYLLRQLKLFKSGFRGSHPDDQFGAQMRASVQVLETEQDMTDVVAYIKSLQ